jgi:hypothetical protein
MEKTISISRNQAYWRNVASNFEPYDMKNIFGILICFLFLSCIHNEPNDIIVYNKNANEIILKALKDTLCDCVFEIQNKSIIQESKHSQRFFDIEKFLTKELNLKDKSSLDSVISVSSNFKLDSEKLKNNHIKIITMKDFQSSKFKNDVATGKLCSKGIGIMCICRPVFNRDFSRAILYNTFGFTRRVTLFELRNGEWRNISN